MLERAGKMRAALVRAAKFDGFDDPRMTLGEALDVLAARHDLQIDVNHRAFQYENVKEVLKTPIADPNPIRARANVEPDRVLRQLLDRVPVPSGAAYVLRPHGIEVTTRKFLEAEGLLGQTVLAPTPEQLNRARGLRDTLIRPSQFDGFDDPKMTLAEALAFMEGRYGLRFEVNEKAFKYEAVMDVEKTPVADPNPISRPAGLILPGKVLEQVLAKIPVASGAVFVIRPHGHIEVTTRRFVLAELGIDPIPLWDSGGGAL